ncbi:MAG: CoA transferase [PS1 clade bacterium]|nr:CoA transferase [PS1 clade bacterium]
MLEGIKVVEMATYIAAPAAGGVMADWGADVIKIEPLGGCPMRNFFATAMTDDYPDNPVFALDNRGKRAIAVNTSTDEGAEIVRKLAADADVFITNVRPGQLAKQGLDFDTLHALNPKMIYASVTGFGLEGAERDKPGFDTAAFWAKSGIGWMMTPKGASPVPLRVAVGDHITGISTASGILAALLRAQKTGKGTLVESSLVRAGAYVVGSDFSTYMRYGRIARSRPREEAVVPTSNFFQTSDGHWLFMNSRPGEPDWPEIMRATGLEHLADDPRFDSFRNRRKNGPALVTEFDTAFAKHTLDEWQQRLDAEGVIWSPVQSFEQALEDPQMKEAGVFVDMPKADGTSYTAPASPIRFGDANTDPKGPSPEVGEHTDEILETLGFDSEARAKLSAAKVIKTV